MRLRYIKRPHPSQGQAGACPRGRLQVSIPSHISVDPAGTRQCTPSSASGMAMLFTRLQWASDRAPVAVATCTWMLRTMIASRAPLLIRPLFPSGSAHRRPPDQTLCPTHQCPRRLQRRTSCPSHLSSAHITQSSCLRSLLQGTQISIAGPGTSVTSMLSSVKPF